MAAGGCMTTPEVELPGYWRYLWLIFMQPIQLHRDLTSRGITDPLDIQLLKRQQRFLWKAVVPAIATLPILTAFCCFLLCASSPIRHVVPPATAIGGAVVLMTVFLILGALGRLSLLIAIGLAISTVLCALIIYIGGGGRNLSVGAREQWKII